MRLYRSLAALDAAAPSVRRVATVGAFDGVHLGHSEIIDRTLRIAGERAARSIAITFEPTPAEYFARGQETARLTCFRERLELMRNMGVDEMFCPRFASIQGMSAEQFVEELLVSRLDISDLVVGHDFRFGAGRNGTLEWLVEAGSKHGFDVTEIAPVEVEGERVSSTQIRAALRAGDLQRAGRMLGRTYSMSGRVVHGRGMGKELGFPTANVNLKRRLAPVDGIFAVTVAGLADRPLEGVASVGNRPTVGGGETLLEVYIFDFDQDIYGRYITVHFIERLREERRYPDVPSMQRQMYADVVDARAALERRIA